MGLVNLADEGVAVVNFDSGTPRRLGTWENTIGGNQGYVNDSLLLPDGSYGFVATDDWTPGAAFRGGIQVLNLLDAENPILVGTYQVPVSKGEWFPTDLTLYHGHYLLAVMTNAVSQDYRLDVLDLSDPASPALVGTYTPAPATVIEGLDTLDVAGRSYALLACGQDATGHPHVQTVEMTDPSSPVLRVDASTFLRGEAMSAAVAVVAEHPYGYVPIYSLISDRSTVLVIDLSDPSNADTTQVRCWWGEPTEITRFQVARPIRSSWGPLLALSSGWMRPDGGGTDLWDLADSYCPGAVSRMGMREGPWWVSQAPGNDTDLFLGLRGQGVGVASMPTRDLPPPIVLGPFDPPDNTAITEPTILSINGVSSPVGIAKARFYATTNSCFYILGEATAESGSGTYSIPFNPLTLPEEKVTMYVIVYDSLGNSAAFYGGSAFSLGSELPLRVQVTIAPASGVVPLKVSMNAVISGGRPPYCYIWHFGDKSNAYATGPSAEHTYEEIGDFFAEIGVQDGRYSEWADYARVSVTVPPAPAPSLQSVRKMSGPPFRLKVTGSNFLPGCTVRVDEKAAPLTKVVDSGSLVAGSGNYLKVMCPKGHPVSITVLNPDGQQSVPVMFTR